MEYENPNIPEGINVGTEHPLKDFALLAIGVLGTIVLLIVILAWSAEYVARFTPFSFEQALIGKFETTLEADEKPTEDFEEVQRYLESLTARIAAAEGLPDDMTVTVHFMDDETLNAFATLGGHFVIFRGLLERMPSENALAMVIAHEIAHIKHRDPIVAFSRGVTVSVALASMAGLADSPLLGRLFDQAGSLTALKFSREQEAIADDEALEALLEIYGHVHGAETLFEILEQASSGEPLAFFSTHPMHSDRITKIKAMAGNSESAELTALPMFSVISKSENPSNLPVYQPFH
jgi:predicted Zn-dependent protease